MKRLIKRIFARVHRNKFGWGALLGIAVEGVQNALPYLPVWVPQKTVIALTVFAVIGGVVAHFAEPEHAHA